MGYGFGVPCEGGGFQFGVWEFCPPDGSSGGETVAQHHQPFGQASSRAWGPSPRYPDAAAGAGEDGLGGAAEGSWPVFQLLERARWLRVELEVSKEAKTEWRGG